MTLSAHDLDRMLEYIQVSGTWESCAMAVNADGSPSFCYSNKVWDTAGTARYWDHEFAALHHHLPVLIAELSGAGPVDSQILLASLAMWNDTIWVANQAVCKSVAELNDKYQWLHHRTTKDWPVSTSRDLDMVVSNGEFYLHCAVYKTREVDTPTGVLSYALARDFVRIKMDMDQLDIMLTDWRTRHEIALGLGYSGNELARIVLGVDLAPERAAPCALPSSGVAL